MTRDEKEEAIQSQILSITQDAQNLHLLHKKRKDQVARLSEKNKSIEHEEARDIAERREVESRKRIQKNVNVEKDFQKITSQLMMELREICNEGKIITNIFIISSS